MRVNLYQNTRRYIAERFYLFLLTNNEHEIINYYLRNGPPLWSSGQSFWLQIQRSRVRSPALPDFLSSSGFGTGSTQPREPREVN